MEQNEYNLLTGESTYAKTNPLISGGNVTLADIDYGTVNIAA